MKTKGKEVNFFFNAGVMERLDLFGSASPAAALAL